MDQSHQPSDISAVIHHMVGAISFNAAAISFNAAAISYNAAAIAGDANPTAKKRHLRNAVESAKKAVSLSPDSIKFRHFYASLLYEVTDDDCEAFDEVEAECLRALAVENPIGFSVDNLEQHSFATASSADLREEVRSLMLKARVASIASQMKKIRNVDGGKFRLVPMKEFIEMSATETSETN